MVWVCSESGKRLVEMYSGVEARRLRGSALEACFKALVTTGQKPEHFRFAQERDVLHVKAACLQANVHAN